VIHSVAVNRTHNLPIESRTLPLSYRRPSEICVAPAWVSGDVMINSWGITEETKTREKKLG